MANIIRVTAKRKAGFRRCGVAFSSTPTDFPENRFTSDELKRLQSEPNLVVQVLDADVVAKEKATAQAALPKKQSKAKAAPEGSAQK